MREAAVLEALHDAELPLLFDAVPCPACGAGGARGGRDPLYLVTDARGSEMVDQACWSMLTCAATHARGRRESRA